MTNTNLYVQYYADTQVYPTYPNLSMFLFGGYLHNRLIQERYHKKIYFVTTSIKIRISRPAVTEDFSCVVCIEYIQEVSPIYEICVSYT